MESEPPLPVSELLCRDPGQPLSARARGRSAKGSLWHLGYLAGGLPAGSPGKPVKDSIGEDTCAVLSLVPATQFFPEEVLLRLGRVPHSKGRLVGHQPTATDTFIDIKKA